MLQTTSAIVDEPVRGSSPRPAAADEIPGSPPPVAPPDEPEPLDEPDPEPLDDAAGDNSVLEVVALAAVVVEVVELDVVDEAVVEVVDEEDVVVVTCASVDVGGSAGAVQAMASARVMVTVQNRSSWVAEAGPLVHATPTL